MSRERGGKRIQIIVNEVSYPHSKSAKKKNHLAVQIFDSGYRRPKRAVEDAVVFLGDRGYMFSWGWFLDYLQRNK